MKTEYLYILIRKINIRDRYHTLLFYQQKQPDNKANLLVNRTIPDEK